MALKLGKCRLCLKLGDFYSIFTVDNAVQLSEMVMECTRIKVYDGDGLPDKVCSECIQKLSSAYIFKQQCERADQELRRNYVPPPGFSISPPPPNRQSSDSAFSTHTDSSNLKSSFNDSKITSASKRKRSVESDNASLGSHSREYSRPSSTKRVEELRRHQKRPRYSNSHLDSDFDDTGIPETDSDEPLVAPDEHACTLCPKTFKWKKSLKCHMTSVHKEKTSLTPNTSLVTSTPVEDTEEDYEEKINCEKCGQSFKLQIMLKRHQKTCGQSPVKSPQKELLITLEPIDAVPIKTSKLTCEYCSARFKTVDNLKKHLRVVHAAVIKRESLETKGTPNDSKQVHKPNVPCLYCRTQYNDFYAYIAHLNDCPSKDGRIAVQCPLCQKEFTKKCYYVNHVRVHFTEELPRKSINTSVTEEIECRFCKEKQPSQAQLVAHLASVHMSNNDGDNDEDDDDNDAGDDRQSIADDSASAYSGNSSQTSHNVPLKCRFCNKEFKYKKSLISHEEKHETGDIVPKKEKPDEPDHDLLTETMDKQYDSDCSQGSDSSHGEDDNTCDICEKQFSYKRLLIQHKKTKHNQCSGTKRAKINLKDCSVKCQICDIDMKVSEINEHNQQHISKNIKPRNIYTCEFANCSQKFKSCSNLANHIKLVHRLKQQQVPRKLIGENMADFCEVVVTKAEPLDTVQSHNGFVEVPSQTAAQVNLSGFSCHICGKKMPTLISLKRHVNWHTNVGDSIQKQYECFVCKESFRFQCHYKLHMREHYHDTNLDPKLLTCTICGRKSKHLRAMQAHMNFHKQTRFQTKDYQCSICKRVFEHRRVYLSHMAIHYKKGESAQNTVVGDITPNVAKAMQDGAHACQLCGKICDSENSLKHHLIWHKSKTLLYGARHECPICQLQFTNKRHLDLHTRTHYEDDNGPFKCNICGKGYIDEDYMRRHVKGHNFDHQSHKKRIEKLRKGKVKCPICSRYYPELVKLIRHLRRTHPESKMIKEDPDAPPPNYYSCKLCAKVFLDEQRLKKHEESHARKPSFFKCKFCGKKTISLKTHRVHIKGHLTTKYTDEPLKCTQCDERFVWGYALHHHLRDVHGVNETWMADLNETPLTGPLKDLQCSICLKVLASKGNYERHIDYHNSLRCNYCFDYFSSMRFLEGHLAFSCDKKKLIGDTDVHPKKVKCELCYKAFSVQVKLDCHLRTQHGIKVTREASAGKSEIVCDYCFKVFENEYALNTHKLYHRTVGYFGCIYCPRKFSTQTGYRKHKNHHLAQLNVDNPTKCEHCDETFVAFREMIYHMRDVHGDDKEWITMPKDSIEETCNICNKTFFNLHRHLDYHEENRCKKCLEYFYSTADYDSHLCSIVSDDEESAGPEAIAQTYEDCTFCFKPITKKDSKKKHDILHKFSGAISCRFCHLKFKTLDAFNIHAFSHRSRKYVQKPIKCRVCKEKFVKYGPFIKHMRNVHKTTKKVHYRALVKPERCVVCGGEFPNLHNHYRAHLANQCSTCRKYFTSTRLFARHACDKDDPDPTKVFTSDENLPALINSYVPKDMKDDEKYYGYTDDEEEEEPPPASSAPVKNPTKKPKPKKTKLSLNKPSLSLNKPPRVYPPQKPAKRQMTEDERNLFNMVTSPIISDVLSLYQQENGIVDDKNQEDDDVVALSDDDMDINETIPIVVVIDDDD